MIYLTNLQHLEGDLYQVGLIHYKPLDPQYGLGKTEKELEVEGVFVANLPTPEIREGFGASTVVNKTTKEVTFKYYEIPLTPEQEALKKVKALELENANINYALMMGGLI